MPLPELTRGDCVEAMRSLPGGSVDLAFADPPFNIGYEYDTYDDHQSADNYLRWSRDWMAEVVRLLKDDGTFWLAIGDEYAAELKCLMTDGLVLPGDAPIEERHLPGLGLTMRSWVVWYYTFGVNCKAKFSRSHAHLFYMVKDPARFTFNGDHPAVRVPSARQLVYADKRANPKGRLPDDTWMMSPVFETGTPPMTHDHDGVALRPQDLPQSFLPFEDTWYFPRVNGTFKEREGWHGCQMPEQLLGRIVRACSDEGETVLDPFAGSGTTLAVAKKLGRKPVGCELSEEYAARVESRLAAITPGDPLEGAADPKTSVASTDEGKRRRSSRKKTAAE